MTKCETIYLTLYPIGNEKNKIEAVGTMTFEEEFPKLKRIHVCTDKKLVFGVTNFIPMIDVTTFCLDKQKVKDALKKALEKCYVDKLTIQFDVLKEFEKELGL